MFFCLFSGFNAAVSGCFFAVESVLWPSPSDSSSISLTNTTSMVIVSAVIASVVTEVGLGSEPAFKVPYYDFRSPTGILSIICLTLENVIDKFMHPRVNKKTGALDLNNFFC